MVMFDNIEEIFQNIRGFSEHSKALVTLATAVGTLFLVLYFVKLTRGAILGFRLYVSSQLCCRTNFIKKYGKWALVTGSTDGIGQAMARELARRGHSIILVARNEEKLARTKSLLEAEANVGEVMTVKIDLSDSSLENYERARDQIDPDNRDIGILINNAGTFPAKYMRFYRNDMEFLRSIVNVNVLATVYLTRLIMPGMVERGRGLIINVSSLLGSIPAPYMSVYGPTKSFVTSFSRMLQLEYSGHPIEIINMTTGPVHTKPFKDNSLIERSGVLNPTPEDYAKSALNAASTGISSMSGYWFHGLTYYPALFLDWAGLIPILTKINLMFGVRHACVSPVMSRRKPKAQPDRETETTDQMI